MKKNLPVYKGLSSLNVSKVVALVLILVAFAGVINPCAAGVPHGGKTSALGNISVKKQERRTLSNGSSPSREAVNKPAALALPTLSYSSPRTYTAGTSVSQAPTSSGVASPSYAASSTVLASIAGSVTGVAVDGAGNIFIVDSGDDLLKEIPAGSTTPVTINDTFNGIFNVAVDSQNNVYVVESTSKDVKEIPAGGGTPVVVASGFTNPYSVAIDASGSIYIADKGAATVFKHTPGASSNITIGSGFSGPTGVAVDGAGNIYVADNTAGKVFEIQAGTNVPVSIGSGFSAPAGVNVDASGNLFITDYTGEKVYELPVGAAIPVAIGGTFDGPAEVAVDLSGNVLVANDENLSVNEIVPLGGFYISKSLPAGLTFNNSTGLISGTPTAASPATNYVVTAYNSSGSVQATVNIKVILPTPPTISYATPQSYVTGTAISLSPTSANVATGGYNTVQTTVGSGFNGPAGVAADAAGNIYVADFANNAVKKIPAAGGTPTVIGTGFSNPEGVAVDAAGNVYVADYGNSAIKKIAVSGGATTTIGSGFSGPYGVAVDAAGDIYVADSGNNQVKEIPAGSNTPVVLASGFNFPTGVAVNATGDVYIADSGNAYLKKIAAGTTVVQNVVSVPGITCVTVDATGKVLVAQTTNNQVEEITSGGAALPNATGFNNPTGVAVDGSGNLLVADYNNNVVKKIALIGGYFLNTALPAGLSFNKTTGVISGTPTVAAAAANYVVTAYNLGGGTAATLNIKVTQLPLPTISYATPQTFVAGTAATISPTSTGVSSYGYSSTSTLVASINDAPAVAVDASGNVYVTAFSAGLVYKIPAGGGTPVTIGTGITGPNGIAVDATGNVFVADGNNEALKMIAAAGGATTTLATGFTNIAGVALDGAGNLYVTDFGAGTLSKLTLSSGSYGEPVVIASNLGDPVGMAVDAAGNVYVAEEKNGAIVKVPYSSGSYGAPVSVISGLSGADGLALDAAGNLFFSNHAGGQVEEALASGGAPVIIGPTSLTPYQIALGPNGNLYIAEIGNSEVIAIEPTGGYYLSPLLPVGLTFNSTTGVISGTPTAFSAAANYVVTGYNFSGPTSTTVNIKVNLPPAPTIKYATPQTLGLNTAANISPTSTGVSSYGYSSTSTLVASINDAPAVAVDASGNVYVTAFTAGLVYKIPAGGGTPVTIGTGITGPNGIAVDATGNVFVADGNNEALKMIAAAGGATTTLATGFTNIAGVALDGAGNLYVTDFGAGTLNKLTFSSGSYGAPVVIASNLGDPVGMAVDAAGNVYVAEEKNGAIVKVPYSSGSYGAPVSVISGLSGADGLALDASGNLFFSNHAGGQVEEALASGGAPVIIGPTSLTPYQIALGPNGNLYVAEIGNSEVIAIEPTGGYYLNPLLPVGLTFNSTTGVISGTPTVLSAAKTYTATDYNNFGETGTATLSVSVIIASTNNNLSALTTSVGALSPAFAAATLSYTESVAYTSSQITVTPTVADNTATVTVNGNAVTSGAASAAITLAVGSNVLNVVVKAQNGSTKTYIITVTRAASTNATLSNLVLNGGTLTPVFASGTTAYTATVPYLTTSVTLKPVAGNASATIKVNGVAVTSNTPSGAIALNVGANTISTVVTAPDGVTTETYTVTVTRSPKSSIATLANIVPNKGILSPVFASGTTSYTIMETNGTATIGITPTVTDATATITVNGTAVASGTSSAAIPLTVGTNTITIVVTAQDGTTTDTYTLSVIRPSTNAKLASLVINAGALSPVFNTNTTSYTANELYAQSSVKLTPTVAAAGATVSINGTAVASGAASGFLILKVGANTINVVVTAQDGVTTETYTLTVTRAVASTNSNLSALAISKGTLTPAFASSTITYSAMETNGTTSVTLTPATQVTTSTVTVNGVAVVSGHASGAITLVVGANAIPVVVTAQDGVTKKTYTINVIRPSTNAKLSALTISSGTLTPTFNTNTTSYTDAVTNATASVTITPTVAATGATVKVNGTTVASGAASGAIALAVGSNTITTIVTAQDGATTDTYTLTVTRAASGENIPDAAVGVQNSEPSLQLANDGINVHQGVSPNGDGINDYLQIDNISRYPENHLSIMNRNGQLIYEAKGYDNATKVFDGHSNKNGQMQLPGTYFYELDYSVNGIIKHKTGFLVLKY